MAWWEVGSVSEWEMVEAKILKIGIVINAAQKGFLIGLGEELAKDHIVFYIARDKVVKRLLKKSLKRFNVPENSWEPGSESTFDYCYGVDGEHKARPVITVKNFTVPEKMKVVNECVKREKQYGETFSMICSCDRALGKGYILNADNHPDIKKAWWSKAKKYTEVLGQFLFYEKIVDLYRPDLIIGLSHEKVFALVCRHYNIPYYSLSGSRFESKYYWVKDEFETNDDLTNTLKEGDITDVSNVAIPVNTHAEFISNIDYGYRTAMMQAIKQLLRQAQQIITGKYKRDSYVFGGWTKWIMDRPKMYRYFLRHGKKIGSLKGRIVLFPLHWEPEASLLMLSPELNNSMELITWVSKSLPAGCWLVIKEHPDGFGIRPKRYYDTLRKMPNVVLAYPEGDWLKTCDMVVTITGTMGLEAVYARKPVLSYGKHQIINCLPTVEYADSFDTTRKAIPKLLNAHKMTESKAILHVALKKVSFNLPDFKIYQHEEKPRLSLVKTALEALWKTWKESCN